MNADKSSYRQILRSSSIIGGASVINIAVGLVRMKSAAVLLGPAGVGLIGLFMNVMGTAATIAGLGFNTVGTRQIAEASACQDSAAVAAARRALFWGTMALAAVGGAALWLLRTWVSRRVFGDALHASEIGWLGVGVALTVASASQSALLNGMRRIGDLARVSVMSAALSSTIGVGALWLYGLRGLLVFVIAIPLATFVLGHVFVARLPRLEMPSTSTSELAAQWKVLARLGVAFMLASLSGTVAQLIVRTFIQRQLGLEALGHFQAAWMISMTYIGFVLGAMGTDFYPRLTGLIGKPEEANRLINEQTEVALLLSGPIFLAMLALVPWVINLLYASSFAPATAILRLQVLGDILKVASWPLGYLLLAAGDGRKYLFAESTALAMFVLTTVLVLPVFGIAGTGVAFIAMYAVYLPLVFWLARRRTGFAWRADVLRHMSILLVTAILTSLIGTWYPLLGAVVGSIAALAFGVMALMRLSHMTDIVGSSGRLGILARAVAKRIGSKNA